MMMMMIICVEVVVAPLLLCVGINQAWAYTANTSTETVKLHYHHHCQRCLQSPWLCLFAVVNVVVVVVSFTGSNSKQQTVTALHRGAFIHNLYCCSLNVFSCGKMTAKEKKAKKKRKVKKQKFLMKSMCKALWGREWSGGYIYVCMYMYISLIVYLVVDSYCLQLFVYFTFIYESLVSRFVRSFICLLLCLYVCLLYVLHSSVCSSVYCCCGV